MSTFRCHICYLYNNVEDQISDYLPPAPHQDIFINCTRNCKVYSVCCQRKGTRYPRLHGDLHGNRSLSREVAEVVGGKAGMT